MRNTGNKDNTASWGWGDREPYFLVLSVMGRQNSAWEWGWRWGKKGFLDRGSIGVES